jgi:hypothetical protein
MGFCDFRSDVEAQAKAMLAVPYISAKEWLKQFLHARIRNRLAGVRDPNLQNS